MATNVEIQQSGPSDKISLRYMCVGCETIFELLDDLKTHTKTCKATRKIIQNEETQSTSEPAGATTSSENHMLLIDPAGIAVPSTQNQNSSKTDDQTYQPQRKGLFMCRLCRKEMKDMFSLKAHMLIHSNSRPFACSWEGCKDAFKTKGSLKRHMRRHKDERPFICELCFRGFRESGALTRHLKSRVPCTRKKDSDLPLYGKNKAFHGNVREQQMELSSPFVGEPRIVDEHGQPIQIFEVSETTTRVLNQNNADNASSREIILIKQPATPSSTPFVINTQSQPSTSQVVHYTNGLQPVPEDDKPALLQPVNDSSEKEKSSNIDAIAKTSDRSLLKTTHVSQSKIDIKEEDTGTKSQEMQSSPIVEPICVVGRPRTLLQLQKVTESSVTVDIAADPVDICNNEAIVQPSTSRGNKKKIVIIKRPVSSLEQGKIVRKFAIANAPTVPLAIPKASNASMQLAYTKSFNASTAPVIHKIPSEPRTDPPVAKDVSTQFGPPCVDKPEPKQVTSEADHDNVAIKNSVFDEPPEKIQILKSTIEVVTKPVRVVKVLARTAKLPKPSVDETKNQNIRTTKRFVLKPGEYTERIPASVRDTLNKNNIISNDKSNLDLLSNKGDLSNDTSVGSFVSQDINMEQVEIVTSQVTDEDVDDVMDSLMREEEGEKTAKNLHPEENVAAIDGIKCLACGTISKDEDKLKDHLKTHLHKAGYKCPAPGCKIIMDRSAELITHLEIVHRIYNVEMPPDHVDEPDDPNIDVETAYTALKQLLELHGNLDSVMHTVGDQPIKILHACPVCQRTFNLNYLKLHIRVHTGERPNACHLCEKTFRSKDALMKHIQSHSSERNFKCGICGKLFKRISHAREHMKVHSIERNYPCTLCEKSFKSANACKVHMRTHGDFYAHKCQYCHKGFREKGAMDRHVRTHTGEKPYTCKHCGRGFAEHGTLNRHLKAKVPCTSNLARSKLKTGSFDSSQNSPVIQESQTQIPAESATIDVTTAEYIDTTGSEVLTVNLDERMDTVVNDQGVVTTPNTVMPEETIISEDPAQVPSSVIVEQNSDIGPESNVLHSSAQNSEADVSYILMDERDGWATLLDPESGNCVNVRSQDLNQGGGGEPDLTENISEIEESTLA